MPTTAAPPVGDVRRADGGDRLVDLKPRLRPLTWAGAEWALAVLEIVDEPDEDAGSEGGPRSVTLQDALRGRAAGAFVTDPRAFIERACADNDPGAGVALRLPAEGLAAAAEVVRDYLLADIEAAENDAAEYAHVRRAQLERKWRMMYDRWRSEPGGSGLPVPFAAVLTERPEAWLILEAWPLRRTLRYVEDVRVRSFFAELQADIDELKRAADG